MAKQNDCVDYLSLISRLAQEERADRKDRSVLPEPVGEQVVDYLAVSKAWKEDPGRMVNGQQD